MAGRRAMTSVAAGTVFEGSNATMNLCFNGQLADSGPRILEPAQSFYRWQKPSCPEDYSFVVPIISTVMVRSARPTPLTSAFDAAGGRFGS